MNWGWLFGGIPLIAWVYLLLGRGFFWLARERDDRDELYTELETWPSVVAVVPARNEADVIERSLASLLQQNYPGRFRIFLVDDQSSDRTAEIARAFGKTERLEIVSGVPRPIGWTGKPWAMNQGIEAAAAEAPDYLWFTDADIAHAPDNLRRLVARAQRDRLVLTSLMAKLNCTTLTEHCFIPAFVFFFSMLYPFARVNNPRRKLAAAAGGCMLVRGDALEAAGGIPAIRQEIIDDCALVYRLSPIWGFALPLIGAVYAGLTIDSAVQFWRGRGGMWKGRAQAVGSA
jgi:hopene-associated glycosyltransferase HpnB